jgi:hypothetical protein
LGLVAAELFTGKNPLLPDSPVKPIRLEGIGNVQGPSGAIIKNLIEQMLIEETENRPDASEILSRWQEFYLSVCRREHAEKRAAGLKKGKK